MKKFFITGLVIFLPLAVTLAVLIFIVNILTGPFVGFVRDIFQNYGIFEKGFLFLSAYQVQQFVSQVLILAFLFLFTVLLGILTRWVFIHYFIRLGDYVFHRIPVVRSIYKTAQDVIKTIFTTSTRSFQQVVLAPFPNEKTQAIGLVTRENIPKVEGGKEVNLVAVFVPTTPNPTSGFLMMYDPKDLVYLDMKVEDAFKYIISCGVVQTPMAKQQEVKEDEVIED
ncbi:MAG: DUF502 domain-containing protein [Waddliaceae bacterium]